MGCSSVFSHQCDKTPIGLREETLILASRFPRVQSLMEGKWRSQRPCGEHWETEAAVLHTLWVGDQGTQAELEMEMAFKACPHSASSSS